MPLTWSMLSRHARLVGKMRHGASKAAGIAPTAHTWLAGIVNWRVLTADGAC